MRVVICGGGAIGASIAYFLSLQRVQAVVIERTGVAAAASGKSGNFPARDWCDGSTLENVATDSRVEVVLERPPPKHLVRSERISGAR